VSGWQWAWLRGLGRVDYEVPPQEPACLSAPPPTNESVAAALNGIDIRFGELIDVPPWERDDAWHEEVDRLLTRRERLLCPVPPVVPGRSS
jgi:hypothetical protein